MDEQTKYRRSALLVAMLTSFLTPFMGSAVNIALPAMAQDLGLDAILLSWVATAYLLASAVFLVPFGRLADIRGRKLIFSWGIAIFTLASLLIGLAVTPAMVIGFRVLQGVGSAMIFGTGLAILVSVYPPHQRGRVLGFTVACVYAGLSLGPTLGGLLTHHLGWRSVFFVNVPFGLLVLAVALWKLKGEWAEARGERMDLIGALIYGLALSGLIYGLSRLPATTGAVLILAGLLALGVFIRREIRIDQPVLDIRLFHGNRVFAFSNLAAFIHYSATFAVVFLMSLYLQYNLGLSPRDAGLILVCQPIVMAVFSPAAGWLSDHWDPQRIASLGMFITSIGLTILALLDGDSALPQLVTGLVVLGFGLALFSSPNTRAVMNSVARKHFGVAGGTVSTMRVCGQMMSMGVTTMVFNILLGQTEITADRFPAFLSSVRTTLTIFIVLTVFGIAASLARGRTHPRPAGEDRAAAPPDLGRG